MLKQRFQTREHKLLFQRRSLKISVTNLFQVVDLIKWSLNVFMVRSSLSMLIGTPCFLGSLYCFCGSSRRARLTWLTACASTLSFYVGFLGDVFEARTSTGNEAFSLLIGLERFQIRMLGPFTLTATICVKIWS